jgi:ATP-dependent Clp protease ATP-binding subunit ClpC
VWLAVILLGAIAGSWAVFTSDLWPGRLRTGVREPREAVVPAPEVVEPPIEPSVPEPAEEREDGPREDRLARRAVARLAAQTWSRRGAWARDDDAVLADPAAVEALALLRARDLTTTDLTGLIEWALDRAEPGPDLVIALLALELLAARPSDPALRPVVLSLARFGPTEPVRPYVLRVIRAAGRLDAPLLDELVPAIPPSWGRDATLAPSVAALLLGLLDAGDELHPAQLPPRRDEAGPPPAAAVVDAAADALPGAADAARLRRIATLVALAGEPLRFATLVPTGDPGTRARIHETAALGELAGAIASAVEQQPPVSVVVHGEAGSGRSALLTLAVERLAARGYVVIEASPDRITAGQMYVNQLEGRMDRLAAALEGRKAVWLMPGLERGLTSARSSGDPRSFADRLAPLVASGRVIVLAELTREGAEALPRESPALARTLRSVAVPVLGEPDLLQVGGLVVAREAERRSRPVDAGPEIVGQALQLARALLPHIALPGSLARLLGSAVAARGEDAPPALRREDLFAGLSALTGMPRRVLDDTQRLDLDAVRERFAARVLGQPEAIDALVERIALVKAGLCDPERPYGVFLFVGPTGTGKTELARALADELFGSPDRMVRIDMSELKGPESAERIIGTGDARGGESLASRIRAQPFSVVLLDEFEKAYAPLWDLFLQVFDAGRLTDSSGRSVDFRQTIVIVTSNLGSAIESGRSLGFGARGSEGFSSDRVERAVRGVLRPELVNRFDRVIVFRPLARSVMRGIVRNEVRIALRRRGLAVRDWAIEVDESAVEFLLESGFTADLGARPLRRAVERHLLAPLARAIATHEAPSGEQFLLVSSGAERLDVQFVAADVAEASEASEPAPPAHTARDVARECRGRRAELRVLRDTLATLRELTAEPHWSERKAQALAATGGPAFWERDDRFAVLGLVETMDRIEAQLGSAASLLDRLFALAPTDDVRLDPGSVARLARELVQLDRAMQSLEAGEAQDALITLDADEGGVAFAAELAEMYRCWARTRGSRATAVAGEGGRVQRIRIEGLGALAALTSEQGLHICERRRDGRAEREAVVRVAVAPLADGSAEPSDVPEREVVLVRRYQREPTPLVRDLRAGWRTGRLDRVLAGDFDLY